MGGQRWIRLVFQGFVGVVVDVVVQVYSSTDICKHEWTRTKKNNIQHTSDVTLLFSNRALSSPMITVLLMSDASADNILSKGDFS